MKTSEDPILALKVNPAWVAYHEAGAETAVLNEIANFEVGVMSIEVGVMSKALGFYIISKLHMNCVDAELLSLGIIELHLLSVLIHLMG